MPTSKKTIILSLSLLAFILFSSACQTINQTENEKKEKGLLESQKSLIVSLINKGSPEVAIKELRKLKESYPEDADFPNLMGLSYLAMRDPAEAAKEFKVAYKLNPSAHIALNLGSAYIEQKKYKPAIELLERLKALDSTKSYANPERVHHNIGFAYESLKDLKNAEKNYLAALKANPNYYMSLMRLGQVYERSNRPLLAVDTFEKARRVCLVCLDPVKALFYNYKSIGKATEAEMALRSFIGQSAITAVDKANAQKLLKNVSVTKPRSAL